VPIARRQPRRLRFPAQSVVQNLRLDRPVGRSGLRGFRQNIYAARRVRRPRLTAIRKARGLTQVELAKAIGATQRSISYYENDDGVPPASAVIALARALKVSADEFAGDEVAPSERVNDDGDTKRPWKRFQIMTTLPEKDQRAMVRLINSLVAANSKQRLRRAG